MIYLEDRLASLERRVARLEQSPAVCPGSADTPAQRYALCEQVVSSQLGVSLAAIRGRSRPQNVAWARQVVHAMAVEFVQLPHLQIAHLADRDHGTISSNYRAVTNRCAIELQARTAVDTIRQRLRELIP